MRSPFAEEALPKARSNVERFQVAVADILSRNAAKRAANGVQVNNKPPFSPKQRKVLQQMVRQMSPQEQQLAMKQYMKQDNVV